jgi:hypothetical protein
MENKLEKVGFKDLTPVVMKSAILWDTTPCSPLRVNPPDTSFHAGILLGLFDTEDGGDIFFRNVG